MAANVLGRALSEFRDLTSMLQKTVTEMKEADLVKALRADEAAGAVKELKDALEGVYDTHAKVLDQMNRALKVNRERINAIKDEIRHLEKINNRTAEQDKELVTLKKHKSDLLDKEKQLKKQRVQEIKDRTVSSVLEEKQNKQAKIFGINKKALGKAFGYVRIALDAYIAGLNILNDVHKRVFDWQTNLQKSLSTLALRFGTTTESVVDMRDEGLRQLLDPQGLGGLGLSLEDITGKLADFREQLGFTGKITQGASAELVKLGMGVGMAAGEVGNMARVFLNAGQTMEDSTKFMKLISVEAARAGVNTARLAKQFTGASKNLFMLSGPKARTELMKIAGTLERMGISLDKVTGFIDMTDSFDQTVESVSKLNTVFGTHINALEVFAEQDADKRLQMYTDQLKAQGVELDRLTRAQKKFMAQNLGVDPETIDALITSSKLTAAQREEMDKMSKLAAAKAEAEQAFEKSIIRSKQVLVAEQQIAAHINNTLTKQMAPFYDAFAVGGGLEKGMSIFDGYTKKWIKVINDIGKKIGEQGMGGALAGIGKAMGSIWDTILDFISSDSVASFLTGLVGAFEIISDLISGILAFISPPLKAILWLIGKALQLLNMGWKLVKYVGSLAFWGEGDEHSDKAAAELGTSMAGVMGEANPDWMKPSKEMVVQGKAMGGPVAAAQPVVVGERGIELFIPSVPGTIVPNTALAGGGGNSSIGPTTVNVQVILDGQVIQERMYKTNLRSIS